ncbi:MAG: exodeoxyribonuclease VII large subunit [Lachnospiraceae bacterium]|nr:exodeoxyribonuclease VII large subunit [Lachnospiraceae bacterium]
MEPIISVGKITDYISNLISTDPGLMKVHVKGEASNVTYHGSGHLYFTCKDEKAQITCVMWRSKVATGTNFRLKNGDAIVVTGSVEVYGPQGRYQLIASKIALAGQGDIYAEYQRLKKDLEERGMTAAEYKLPLPKVVKRLGVVTSESGRAITDILAVLRDKNCVREVLLMPCAVEGENSAHSIKEGIERIQAYDPDVIIVGRGGGSYESFGGYNTEEVAQAIFDCDIPVISAVGHEDDWVISDLVADIRATTPTKAAEIIVANWENSHAEVDTLTDQLNYFLDGKMTEEKQKLQLLQEKIKRLDPEQKLKNYRIQFMQLSERMNRFADRCISENRQMLTTKEEHLIRGMEQTMQKKKYKMQLLSGRLDGVSPLKRLAAGFVFAQDSDGHNVRSVTQLTPGEEVTLSLRDGKAVTTVQKVQTSGRKEG